MPGKVINLTSEDNWRRATERLAAIVESSEDAIIGKTLDGVITDWNNGAYLLFGYTEEEALGRNVKDIMIPPELYGEEDKIMAKIKKGEKVSHLETRRCKKGGGMIDVSVTISPIKDMDGNVIGVSNISRDISERVRYSRELKKYNERLEELNEYKDLFVTIASHELKTPLTVIKANLQVMDMRRESGENKDLIENSIRNINKVTGIINEFLDVAKIEKGELDLAITDFDLHKLVGEVIHNLQATTHKHKIMFTNEPEQIMVSADRDRIERVLINLLSNSIKYSPAADQILVSVEKTNGDVVVRVEDFGIGIPQKDIDKIFSRFYRAKDAMRKFAGTGMGLYISQQIIKQHHGNIWFKSEPAKGTVFYFSLPA